MAGLTVILVCSASSASRPIPLTVHFFISSECPVSQRYSLVVAKFRAQYSPDLVRFTAWFPVETDTPPVIRRFRRTYGLAIKGRQDVGGRTASRLRVQVAPSVVVIEAGRVRYRGAIDDWYVALGKHRAAPTQHYLRDALDALLANRPILVGSTEPVGCLLN